MKRILPIFLLLLSTNAFAEWTIIDDSVFIEDEYASIKVTPHTAISPINVYKQEFTVCNKTEQETNLYAAYVFDDALISGKVEYWQEPVYEILERQIVCDYDYNYLIGGGDNYLNRNKIWCFEEMDINGTDVNFVHWESDFNTGYIPTKTVIYKWNQLTSGNNWVDVTNGFTPPIILQNKLTYPYIQGLSFSANSCETWRIEYSPTISDSNKWDLWLWADTEGWDCILTDTCQKTLKLDPWYDPLSDWDFKQKLTLNTDNVLSGNVTNDHVILVDINSANTDFWDSVQSDGGDVRFVNIAEDGLFDYHFESFDSDTNRMIAWVEVTDTYTSGSPTELYTYYGNSEAVDAQDEAGTYPAAYTAGYHMEDNNATGQHNSTSEDFDLIHRNSPTDTTGKIDGAVNYATNEDSTNGTLGDAEVTAMSGSFWVKHDGTWDSGATTLENLIIKDNAAGNWWNLTFYLDGQIRFHKEAAAINVDTANTVWLDGVWYHVVFTFQSGDAETGEIILYVNGDENATSGNLEIASINAGTRADFWLSSEAGSNYLNATIDEFKMFYSTALTADEVALIYASENNAFIEFGEEEENITPTCDCPASGEWLIADGSACTLTSTCTITGDLHIESGSLNIVNGVTLALLSGKKLVLASGQKLSIKNGGKLTIEN